MATRTIDYLAYGFDSDMLVPVEVVDGLTPEDIDVVDAQWELPMSELVTDMTRAGYSSNSLPPSWGWTWRSLLEGELTATSSVIGIEYESDWQGLMLVYTDPRPCYHRKNVDGI